MRNQSLPNASLLNTGLYGLTVLIWGTTWIALTYQVGLVAPELSVAYRFAIAAAVVFLWALLARHPLRFPWGTHRLLLAMGLCMFSFNFYFFYLAAAYLTSGLLAVVFSMTIGSEEHTSELQSLMRISYAVFCLKKKQNTYIKHNL